MYEEFFTAVRSVNATLDLRRWNMQRDLQAVNGLVNLVERANVKIFTISTRYGGGPDALTPTDRLVPDTNRSSLT